MKEFIKKLSNSLDTTSSGFSGRKLTALASIIIAAYVTYQLPADAKLYALYSWQTLALLCLGIVTIEQIVKLKNGNEPKA
jgi:hypothetical protein